MIMKKTSKALGIILFAAALVALGHWWGQKRQQMDHAAVQGQTAAIGDPGAHAGHDMSGGDINIPADKQQLVGIRTTVAEVRPLAKKIRTVGIVTYDETRIAQVFTKIDGWIEQLFVNYTGKRVQKNQPLFTLYSPDLVATQEEYLLALQAKDALASSSLTEIRSGSLSLLDATRRRLSLWDISDGQIDELQRTREPKKSLTIFSPISGFVIKKDAFQGMKVMPDKELYTIADLSTVWVNADIYEFELAQIRLGQIATISLSYFPGRVFSGKVAWVAPVMDEKTRTAKVRLEFPNHDFTLKPEMYANVEIAFDAGRRLAIPDEAVLDSGLRQVVFLDKGDGRFAPAEVKLGSKYDNYYEVLAGLSPGERILSSASFLLDSESRLTEAMGAMAGHDMKGAKPDAPAKSAPQEKKRQDLTLTFSTDPVKPKAGEIIARLKIADKTGNLVKDAQVAFVFQMNMQGMVPSTAEGKISKEGSYEAKGHLSMAGEWEVIVTIRRPGQKDIQEKFRLVAQL